MLCAECLRCGRRSIIGRSNTLADDTRAGGACAARAAALRHVRRAPGATGAHRQPHGDDRFHRRTDLSESCSRTKPVLGR